MTKFIQADVTTEPRSPDRERLAVLQSMLHGLGMTLWQTDMNLRLVESHGMDIADGFHGRTIDEFYRQVYDVTAGDGDPVRAHRDARDGSSVTLHVEHRREHYVMFIEPHRDPEGEIIGTIGMSLRVE